MRVDELFRLHQGNGFELYTQKIKPQKIPTIFLTAKDDEEIKALFDQWSDDASNEENQYKDFQNLITDALDDMNRDDEGSTENEAFSSKVWVNGDGKIVGRQFGITDGTDTTPVFTWKAPSEGEDSALLLELAADDSSFTFIRQW